MRSARRGVLGLLAALAVAIPATASAAPRIAVGPVAGAHRGALDRQLRAGLCDLYACVPWGAVAEGGRVDAARLRRLDVAGAVAGRIVRGRDRWLVALAFTKGGARPALAWRLPLDASGMIDAAAFLALVGDLDALLRPRPRAPRPPAVAEAPPPAPAPEAAPLRAGAETEPPARPPPAPAPRVDAPSVDVPLPPPPAIAPRRSAPPPPDVPLPPPPSLARRRAARPPWLAIEVGVFAARRELRFDGATPGPAPLREHVAPAVVGPDLLLELRPAAALRGAARGIGVFARYAFSAGLETRVDGGAPRRTELARRSVGLAWRSPSIGAVRLAVSPALSWEARTFSVSPRVEGLADAALSGAKAALALEVPAGRFALHAGGGYVRWLEARELVAGELAFFPGGRAWALELEGGASMRVAGPVWARVIAEYADTRYALDPDPSGIYRAAGARDRSVGVRAALRAAF